MGVAIEIFNLILGILWCYVVSAYRLIVPIPRRKINGEIALVTGGGGKIGECIAAELVKEDVTIVLWDVNEHACERVAKKLRKEGATVYSYKCDLTNKDEVYSVAKKVEEEVGHVTILINNAGILISRTFLNCSDQELAKQVEINTISHFWTTKAFLPHMQEIDYGHIVTVSSNAGMFGVHYLVGYCTSKFGALGFHESLTNELMICGKTGVKTTCLCPFVVDTPLIGTNSSRFPSMFPRLTPEFVASELVDGMLRNKTMVVLPKSQTSFLLMRMIMPEKANQMMYKFFQVQVDEESAETMFKRREEASLKEDKKCE